MSGAKPVDEAFGGEVGGLLVVDGREDFVGFSVVGFSEAVFEFDGGI